MRQDRSGALPVSEIRAAHWLRPSRNVGFPAHHIALCVRVNVGEVSQRGDTRPVALRDWLAHSWHGGPYVERDGPRGGGDTELSFWSWLSLQLRPKTTTWLWQVGAAAGGTILGLWDRLTSGLWQLLGDDPCDTNAVQQNTTARSRGLCVVEDQPTIILARPTGAPGIVKWVDVRNLGVDSWSALKLAHGDTAGLAQWLREWIRTVADLNLGGLRHTAAAQSWHGWRHGYLDEGILIHNDDRAIALERDSLHPGRAESYRLGSISGPVYQLDATAHYPGCAALAGQPCRLRFSGPGSVHDVVAAEARGYAVIARCRVRCSLPCLPCRRGEDTIWPVGEWETVLAGPELALARRVARRVSVSEMSVYEPGKPWRAYMQALWIARQNASVLGKSAAVAAVKRLMNSAVGKTAAWGFRWMDDPRGAPPDAWCQWYATDYDTGTPTRWRSIGWHAQREVVTGEHPESCPQLASWVYSLARVRLWEWLEIAGRENVYYVDTDSLWCNEQGYQGLRRANQVSCVGMGSLRIVGVHDWLRIHGIKAYETPAGSVVSGVPKQGATIESAGYQFWCPETVRDTLRALPQGRAPQAQLVRYAVPMERPYRHGKVLADGRIVPIEV